MSLLDDLRLLTPEEVAELLQVKKSTIYKWTHLKFIPHIKVGHRVRFRVKDIDAWLKKRSVKGRAKIKLSVDYRSR